MLRRLMFVGVFILVLITLAYALSGCTMQPLHQGGIKRVTMTGVEFTDAEETREAQAEADGRLWQTLATECGRSGNQMSMKAEGKEFTCNMQNGTGDVGEAAGVQRDTTPKAANPSTSPLSLVDRIKQNEGYLPSVVNGHIGYGHSLEWCTHEGKHAGQTLTQAQADSILACLLYTSPSPRDS